MSLLYHEPINILKTGLEKKLFDFHVLLRYDKLYLQLQGHQWWLPDKIPPFGTANWFDTNVTNPPCVFMLIQIIYKLLVDIS